MRIIIDNVLVSEKFETKIVNYIFLACINANTGKRLRQNASMQKIISREKNSEFLK